MFDSLPKSQFLIVSKGSSATTTVDAIATGNEIVVPNEQVVIQPGDEMRRALPNGTDEVFEVVDPVFNQETFGIPGHFLVKVRKKGLLPHGSGGNFNIHVEGANSRVNIASDDRSLNVVGNNELFTEIRQHLEKEIDDAEVRQEILGALQEMEAASSKNELAGAYQRFIGASANHMTIITPFLPALGMLFGA